MIYEVYFQKFIDVLFQRFIFEEINSYINAAQLEKLVNISKKLNVTSKDRMISDLNMLLLHLIQTCHTFESKYRPMQTRIRVRSLKLIQYLSHLFLCRKSPKHLNPVQLLI
jgi:hypothetical protein